jgi:uncharacterized protein YaiE (UPF0345 family)
MTTLEIRDVSVTTQANVYFGDRCVSHALSLPDGTRKSVGVVFATEQTFSTAQAEVMECVAGWCEYRLEGDTAWRRSSAGESFQVAANARFDIRVTEPYHYICHYG